MIYVAPSHPELVAIDKNTGEIFVVDLNTMPKYTSPIPIEGPIASTSPIEGHLLHPIHQIRFSTTSSRHTRRCIVNITYRTHLLAHLSNTKV